MARRPTLVPQSNIASVLGRTCVVASANATLTLRKDRQPWRRRVGDVFAGIILGWTLVLVLLALVRS